MKLPKTVKPELCASEDQNRMSIAHPWTVKAGDETFLVATDGRKMVRFPVTLEEGEEPGPVPCKAFDLARKECNGRNREAIIHANGVVTLSSGATLPRPMGFLVESDTWEDAAKIAGVEYNDLGERIAGPEIYGRLAGHFLANMSVKVEEIS